MAGTARKSTGGRKKVTKAIRTKVTAGKKAKRVEIDPNKDYVVDKIGPIYIGWGKRRKKNKKGKVVKEYYIKDSKKHHVWVKWQDIFADDKAQGKFEACQWSAEPQDSFLGESAKEAVKQCLKEKIIWPWPAKGDDSYEDRRAALLAAGYKEWKPQKGKSQKWDVQDAIEPQTGSSDDGSENEESTSTGTDEPEEEEENDEV